MQKEISVYNFSHYKDVLFEWIRQQPHNGHGSKALLAKVTACQTSYISQVLNGSAHLSLEQAEKVARRFGFTNADTRFFLLLVQKARAGSESLKRLIQEEIKAILEVRSQLKNRIQDKVKITPEAQARYFSNWLNPAVHLLAISDTFNTRHEIAKRLSVTEEVVNSTLSFLMEIGILAVHKSKIVSGSEQMHLPHDSAFIKQHHSSWRIKALQDIEQPEENSLHYSSVVTISKEDGEKIKLNLLQTIEEIKKTIKASPSDDLYSFCMDFYRV